MSLVDVCNRKPAQKAWEQGNITWGRERPGHAGRKPLFVFGPTAGLVVFARGLLLGLQFKMLVCGRECEEWFGDPISALRACDCLDPC